MKTTKKGKELFDAVMANLVKEGVAFETNYAGGSHDVMTRFGVMHVTFIPKPEPWHGELYTAIAMRFEDTRWINHEFNVPNTIYDQTAMVFGYGYNNLSGKWNIVVRNENEAVNDFINRMVQIMVYSDTKFLHEAINEAKG